MHLRHKKPLNPYKGQANNDKNEEFNDDDFRQQASPLKKAPNPATEQISKYAKLLAKFVKTANEDYRLHRLRNHLQDDPLPPPAQFEPMIDEHDIQLNNIALKWQQIKYQKQVPKLQTKREAKEESKPNKNSHKKKEPIPPQTSARENKSQFAEGSPQNAIDLTKNSIMPRNPHENNPKKSQAQIKSVKNDRTPQPPPPSFPPKMEPGSNFNLQGPLNMPPQLNALGLNTNLPGYLGLQGLFNPNQLGMYAGLNQMQLEQLRSMGMRFNPLESIIPSYMPNMNNMSILLTSQMLRPNLKSHHNLFIEQVKFFNQAQRPPSTHPQPPSQNPQTPQEVYPLKRSAFHAGIAYNIYLDKLKKQGVGFDNLEEIDPTRNARRVKSGQAQPRSKQAFPFKRKK